MNDPAHAGGAAKDALFHGERFVASAVQKLTAADRHHLAHWVLNSVRLLHRNKPVDAKRAPSSHFPLPNGPFGTDDTHDCALLAFVPRNLKSQLIDDMTGAYGYSHVTVDCCEIDQETGKRIMTESTTEGVVHRCFQDSYGARPFVRIPLHPVGVDCAALRACVNAKLGEKYDAKEALTWGAVDDPARQICSDLAGNCLPPALREDIAREHHNGNLPRASVSVHRHGGRVFITPNAFCKYFGAPPGKQVEQPDQLIDSKRGIMS